MTSSQPVVIRTARAADLDSARALLQRASLPVAGLEEHFGPGYAVAESRGTVVGVTGIERHGAYGLLRSAVIDPAWRGQGVGEALTRNRLAWAAAVGIEVVYLLTETAADWFPRFGFTRVDRGVVPPEIAASGEFAHLCPASAVAMHLDLRSPPPAVPDESPRADQAAGGPPEGHAARSRAGVTVRAATVADVPLILHFIRGLAEYERLPHEVVATEARLEASLFGERPDAEVLIALEGDTPAGFALFFHNYSTFLARRGISLEDLFVLPGMRGRGIGRRLLAELARLAVARDCGRLEWSVLDWNEDAIRFYRSLGAKPMDEWTTFRLTGETLQRLANEVAEPGRDGSTPER